MNAICGTTWARCSAYRLMVMRARADRELVGVDSYLESSGAAD